MAEINLIPPKLKTATRNRQITGLAFTYCTILILMTAFVFAALFGINSITIAELQQTNQILEAEKSKAEKLEPIEQDVLSINAKILKLITLKNQRTEWSKVLSDFNHSTPEMVQTTTLTISTKDKKVAISGSAESRRDIVKLSTKLGSLGYFLNLTFPTSTYNESENMYLFNMTGEMKK